MKFSQALLVVLLSAATAFLTAFYTFRAGESPSRAETAYERVMRTQTLRCGYNEWSVFLSKDPNTGAFSGIFYDYMEALGQNLGVKIVWAEEMGDENNIPALVNGRVDAFCNILFWNAKRARQADFTQPLFYMGTEVYVRADDHRFDESLQKINDPSVKVLAVDGDIFALIAEQDFPKAPKGSLPQMTSEAELFLNLATGKGDVVLMEPYSAADFMKSNPRKIKRMTQGQPLRSSPVSLMIRGGEEQLRRMIDVATIELQGNGTLDRILDKYDRENRFLYRVALPFSTRGVLP